MEALRELDALPEADRHRTETLELRAVLLQQLGRWEEAGATYEVLCRQDGACAERFIAWGCCLYEQNRISEARAAPLAAPDGARQNGLWNFHLACYESLLGNPDEARRLVRRSLEIEPRLRSLADGNSHLAPLLTA